MKQLPRIVLKGDRQAAEEMIREGVRQFDILLQQMKFAGLKQDVRRVRYLDGSEIVCRSVFGDNTLEIYVPPEVEEREEVLPPPSGDFIVFYKDHNLLMRVEKGELKMTPVRDVQRPPMAKLNTSIALRDKVVDITLQHTGTHDPGFFGYSGYSEYSRESVCIRSGSKICLEKEAVYSFNIFSQFCVPGSYAIWHSANWDVVCFARMHPRYVAEVNRWTYVIYTDRYVWDRGKFKLADRIEKQLHCDEEKYPSAAYPIYILRMDNDGRGVLYNIGWYIVSENRHIYETRWLDILSGEDALVTTHGSSYTSAAVHRHRLNTSGVILVEGDTIGKCKEGASGDWRIWRVDGSFVHLEGRDRPDYPECNTEQSNGYRYEFEWNVDDYTLGGFEIEEDIHFKEFWQECLQSLNPEPPHPTFRLWFRGSNSLSYKHKLKWPDGKDLVELSGPVMCWHFLVNERTGSDCSGHVEWGWTGTSEDIDTYSFWIEGVPGRGGALTRHPATQIPYRRLALIAGARIPTMPYAFFAKNGPVTVKMLLEAERENGYIHYNKVSVLVNDTDRTEDFLREFERVTGETFDPDAVHGYTVGLLAYVGGEDE